MDKSFSITFQVEPSSIDDLGHVNNVNYLIWVQEIAEKHWSNLTNPSIENNYIWVVLRHEIDYFSAAFKDDQIILKTWIGDSYGIKSERHVEVIRNGKVICKAKTIWCLLDKISMKPVRIPTEISKLLTTNKII
tara:strand:- start:4458 stop:4859 length:402 start_codon:yes stop_codon:yes gene_type:complete